MICYNCGCRLSEKDFCTGCGADVALYKKIIYTSNFFYNEGLEKASVRDLSGAVTSLRQSLKFNKNNVEARNLLGLVYFEMGEVVKGLSEWVISKNLRAKKNIADDYIDMIQENPSRLETINQTIKKYNLALGYCQQDSLDLAVIQLKKVLSLNPKFVRAHQLLALLYMREEEWEKKQQEWMFPPREYMIQFFPILRRVPCLLCVCWGIRVIRIFKKSVAAFIREKRGMIKEWMAELKVKIINKLKKKEGIPEDEEHEDR